MFSNLGLFAGIRCPDFDQGCKKPYCLFRHKGDKLCQTKNANIFYEPAAVGTIVQVELSPEHQGLELAETIDSVQAAIDNLKNQLKLKKRQKSKKVDITYDDLPPTPPQADSGGDEESVEHLVKEKDKVEDSITTDNNDKNDDSVMIIETLKPKIPEKVKKEKRNKRKVCEVITLDDSDSSDQIIPPVSKKQITAVDIFVECPERLLKSKKLDRSAEVEVHSTENVKKKKKKKSREKDKSENDKFEKKNKTGKRVQKPDKTELILSKSTAVPVKNISKTTQLQSKVQKAIIQSKPIRPDVPKQVLPKTLTSSSIASINSKYAVTIPTMNGGIIPKSLIKPSPYISKITLPQHNIKNPTPVAGTDTLARGKRVAHKAPSQVNGKLARPRLPTPIEKCGLPHKLRYNVLMKMIDKLAELKLPVAESYKRALQYEFELADQYHKNNKAVYLSKASSAIKNFSTANFSIGGGADVEKDMLKDRYAHLVQGIEFYNRLLGYTLNNDQLRENGFPLLDMMSGVITINTENKTKPHKPSSLHLRDKDYAFICRRCGKEFILHKENLKPDSDLPEDSWNECHYHPGKCWSTSAKPKFSCCGGNPGVDACTIGDRHVHEYNRYTDLEGYEMTTDTFNEQLKVFALDCEMCYTRHGMELTRITVVDDNEKVIYDTFVQPQGDIIDYNTQFSGVTPEAMAQTNVTIEDVQNDLGKLFTVDSIILGHGLDGDFIALKLVHCKVVDTSVVFPHKKGLPYKRKLKTLMFDHLKKVIQEGGTVDVGHDSSEDAIACLLLMKWKIKEDAKTGNTI